MKTAQGTLDQSTQLLGRVTTRVITREHSRPLPNHLVRLGTRTKNIFVQGRATQHTHSQHQHQTRAQSSLYKVDRLEKEVLKLREAQQAPEAIKLKEAQHPPPEMGRRRPKPPGMSDSLYHAIMASTFIEERPILEGHSLSRTFHMPKKSESQAKWL